MQPVERNRIQGAIRGFVVVLGLLAVVACSPEPAAPVEPAQPEASAPSAESAEPAQRPRFPSPPGSRSIGSSVEPGVLDVPLGPAAAGSDVPMERVEADVRRRMSVLGTNEDGAGLAEFYRAHIESNGYDVLFECEGMEACGGPGFVSAVAETFVTQPRRPSNASMVTSLMGTQSGFVRHYSLRHAAGNGYVTVTEVHSDAGPVAVLTQSTE